MIRENKNLHGLKHLNLNWLSRAKIKREKYHTAV